MSKRVGVDVGGTFTDVFVLDEKTGRAEVAKLLIDHGLDPSDMHADGYTPLHRACWGREERHTETVRVLLEAGVPPTQATRTGYLPATITQNIATRKVIHEFIHQDSPGRPQHDEA